MPTDDHELKFVIAVSTLLIKDGKVFLLRRANTGWEDGRYNPPGGHLNGGETTREAVIREVYEETGVKVRLEDLHFYNVSHLVTNSERVHFYFLYKKLGG